MEHSRLTTGLATLFFALAGCGGGGGGGGGDAADNSAGASAPVSGNSAPTVATEPLVVGSAGQLITLMADGSDSDGDSLTYRWTQNQGSDAIDTQGFDAATMSFRHSGDGLSVVETLVFTVEVSDGQSTGTASVNVLVAKDATRAIFVDGESGSDDSGSGSIETPYASIEHAAENGGGGDIYVRTLPGGAAYEEDTNAISLVNSASLFGGFDENWNRDIVGNKTVVRTESGGIRMLGANGTAELSGLDVTATNPRGHSDQNAEREALFVRAVQVLGTNDVIIKHNVLASASAVPEIGYNFGGSSLAVKVENPNSIEITDNVIMAGDGNPAMTSSNPGGYVNYDSRIDGGTGGKGGDKSNENGKKGNDAPKWTSGGCSRGGAGGSGSGSEGGNGFPGALGCYGADGTTGAGGTGYGHLVLAGRHRGFRNSRGGDGQAGGNALGGGGGGGGEAASGIGLDGGAGGTGGKGGRGGAMAPGSFSGGASVGIEILQSGRTVLRANNVLTGNGAAGGDSSGRNYGEDGSYGTRGSKGKSGVLNDGGDGGNGGRGGDGGDSGWAGAGGGGPSFAVILGQPGEMDVRDNIFETGNGGVGGAPYTSSRRPVGIAAHSGNGGWSVGIFHWDPELALEGITNNTFVPGEAGAGGNDRYQPGKGVQADIANPESPLPLD
jgi:hypothetical protein